jgi:tetratricopeptide (TPR) repeat protein
MYSTLNEINKSKASYEKANRLYEAENIKGLYLGKLFQNYGGLLAEQKEFKKSIVCFNLAEIQFLLDKDLVGGIDCRILIAESNLFLGLYKEALNIIEPNLEVFNSILENCDLAINNINLHRQFSIIALYNDLIPKFIDEAIRTLELALNFSSSMELLATLVKQYCEWCIIWNDPRLTYKFIEKLYSSEKLQKISEDVSSLLRKGLWNRSIIRDKDGIYHSTRCTIFRKNHFLATVSVCNPANILTQKNITTCSCLKKE